MDPKLGYSVSFGFAVVKPKETIYLIKHSCSGESLQDWKQLLDIRVREECFAADDLR